MTTTKDAVVKVAAVKGGALEDLKAALGLPAAPTQAEKDQAAKDFKAELPEGKPKTIGLKDLRPSKDNLRKTFHGIEELAANMSALGRVLSPLLVRMTEEGHYEIIAGGRRYLAAKAAKFSEVPCIVVAMTDAQVAEVMLTENLQREDLQPIEEAEGFRRLESDHNYSVAQIAAKIGKSKGHVFARLKLLGLGPEARKALADNRIDATVAVALARRGHKDQARALLSLCPKGGESLSSRAALDFLQDFARTLKSPPFDQKDITLVTKQLMDGVVIGGSCISCPHRSGSTPGLFDDIKGHDTCTFTPCFDLKTTASWKKASAAAEAKGAGVLTVAQGKSIFNQSNDLSQPSDYVLANTIAEGDPKKRTWRQLWSKLPDDARPELFFIPDRQQKGRECFKREAILESLRKDQKWAAKQVAVEQTHGNGTVAPDEWMKEQREKKARDRVVRFLVESASEGVEELRLPELRIIALAMSHDGHHEASLSSRKLDDKTVDDWIATKGTGKELSGFVFELALTSYLGNGYQGYSEEAKAMASRLKVDLKTQEKIYTNEAAAIAKADADKAAAEDLMKKPSDAKAPPVVDNSDF